MLTIFQIIIALLLIGAVILQNRGAGGSSSMGFGGGESYRSKRGLEKFLFYATIVLGVLFAATSILALVLR